MSMRYGILIGGDAQGGSRDDLILVSEEEARSHVDDGWSKAVRITIEPLHVSSVAPEPRSHQHRLGRTHRGMRYCLEEGCGFGTAD